MFFIPWHILPAVIILEKICISSVAQSRLTLCDPMDCSTPGFPIHYQLPEPCSDSCPSSRWCHPTTSSSIVTFSSSFSLSQHQSLFTWVSSLYQLAKIVELQLQHQSFQWVFKVDFLWMDWFDLLAVQRTLKSLLQHYSSKASIFQRSVSSQSNSHIHTWPLEKP